jgi:hypothetical protein
VRGDLSWKLSGFVKSQGVGIGENDGRDDVRYVVLELVDAHAVARRLTGRRYDLPDRETAEFLVHGKQPLDHAGRGDGAGADVKLLLGGSEVGEDRVEVDLFTGQLVAWCLHEKIEQDRAGATLVREQEAASP